MKSFSLRLLLYVVVLGLGMGAAFGAGVAYGKVATPNSTADASRAASADQPVIVQRAASGTAGGAATGGNAREAIGAGSMGAAMTARPVISGTVESVAADAVTVATEQGQPTKVTVGQRTAIQKTGAIGELKKGDRIAVIGQRGNDGVVAAAIIQLLP